MEMQQQQDYYRAGTDDFDILCNETEYCVLYKIQCLKREMKVCLEAIEYESFGNRPCYCLWNLICAAKLKISVADRFCEPIVSFCR